MYLAKLESRFLVESDFKSKIRNAFIPILLTMMGCGVDDSKKDKPTPEETTPTSVSSDPYTPTNSSQKKFERTMKDLLAEKGWGCNIHLDQPKKNVLVISFEMEVDDIKVNDRVSFGLVFRRSGVNTPWELTSMSPSSQRSYDQYPPLVRLRQDVKDAVQHGVNYLKNRFDCIFPPGGDEPL